tara:strand:- start:70 stop:423 length:354 start_codon:yes stop_codon:yes gene_type:complete
VLNSILLSFLFGLVPFLLYVSVVINVLLVWFSFRMLNTTSLAEKEMLTLFEKLEQFTEHVEELHSMEMFYGEPVLQDLIDHSRRLVNDMVDYQEKFYDYETVEEEYASDEETSETQE